MSPRPQAATGNAMVSLQTVVFVGFVALVTRVAYPVVSSPWVLLALSPLIIFLLGLAFLVLHVVVSHWLDSSTRRSKYNVSHATRPFAFSTPAAWEAVMTRSQWSHKISENLPPLYPPSPAVSAEVNELLNFIIRDFVLTWYKDISDSPSFPASVRTLVHSILDKLLHRAEGLDIPSLVVKRIVPKITSHIEQFRQSEMALRGAGLERRLTQSEELDLLLASRYTTGKDARKLHSAIDNLSTTFTKQSEETHLRRLIGAALPLLLPEAESQSTSLKIVAREIAACSVLYPVMEMLADPDFWNRAIDQLAGAAIHQQKLISKVRNVLEAQSPKRPHQEAVSTILPTAERITIRTDARQFESFLRSISRTSSLLDARRLKNDIVGEIRRTRMLLANHEKEDWIEGERTEDVVAFLDRLYTAKRRVEKRIVILGGEDHSRQQSMAFPDTSARHRVNLRDILRNPSSLSYFMEFMDRRNRSLLVQFWLTVESFKNPLESIDSGSENDDEEAFQDPSLLATVKEDIAMINELYFSGPSPHPLLASIPRRYIDLFHDFASQSDPSLAEQRKVRRSVFLAQNQVERSMEQDFEEFERSELWFRAVGDTDLGSKKPTDLSPVKAKAVPPHLTIPEAAKRLPTMQQSGSTPDLGIKRTASSGSTTSLQSTSSAPPARVLPSNIEILMSPAADVSVSSRAPLFDDPEDEAQRAEEQRMDAIRSALTDIIASEERAGPGDQSPEEFESSEVLPPPSSFSSRKRKPVFEDDIFGADEADADSPEEPSDYSKSVQVAAPGDLQLSYEINRLGDKIANLRAQEKMLDSLIRKAELTGDKQELRILNESKSSMTREIRELEFQKTQYEQQESANRLIPDRTKVAIVSSTSAEEEGKTVVRYLVEIQQLGPDGSFESGWVVARRYNEFLNMHNKLRDKYALVRTLEFPGRRLVTALSSNLVDTRKVALEKYLQNLISIPIVCESDELRGFLSRNSPFTASEGQPSTSKSSSSFSGTDLVRNVYKSVAESIDDMFFGPSMLDVMIQRLTRQAAEFAGVVGAGVHDEDLVTQALKASGRTGSLVSLLPFSADLNPLEGESGTSTFSAPICDLVLAIFELNKENNWLRKQAIVIILQQVLGGTIERKIREISRSLVEESRLLSYITLFRDQLWPDGKLKPPTPLRTAEEKLKTKEEANRKLSALFPDLAANVIGRSNARRGARRIFAVLQNRRLNQHIVYAVVDEIFAALFPEVSFGVLSVSK